MRAMVAHTDRERQGKSTRNMQYTDALDTFAQVLFSVSPAAYRVFNESFPARSVSSLKYVRRSCFMCNGILMFYRTVLFVPSSRALYPALQLRMLHASKPILTA